MTGPWPGCSNQSCAKLAAEFSTHFQATPPLPCLPSHGPRHAAAAASCGANLSGLAVQRHSGFGAHPRNGSGSPDNWGCFKLGRPHPRSVYIPPEANIGLSKEEPLTIVWLSQCWGDWLLVCSLFLSQAGNPDHRLAPVAGLLNHEHAEDILSESSGDLGVCPTLLDVQANLPWPLPGARKASVQLSKRVQIAHQHNNARTHQHELAIPTSLEQLPSCALCSEQQQHEGWRRVSHFWRRSFQY